MATYRLSTIFLALTLLLALAGPADALTDEERSARARQHLERAKIAYKIRDFHEAVAEFKAAYRLRPVPALLFNIAQAERMAGNFKESKFYYEFYLRDQPQAANRGEIEEQIRQLTALIEEEESSAALADRAPAQPPPAPETVVAAPEVAAEPEPEMPLPTLVPPAPSAPDPSERFASGEPLPEPGAGKSYVLPISLGAASVVAGVAGAVLYGMARSGWSDAMKGGRPGGQTQQIIESADSKYHLSLGLGGAAALLGAGAAVTFAF